MKKTPRFIRNHSNFLAYASYHVSLCACAVMHACMYLCAQACRQARLGKSETAFIPELQHNLYVIMQ